VPPADGEALAAALRRLLELEPEGRRQLGAAGRSRVLSRFSISQIAERYEELYEEVADDARYRCA